MMIGSSARGYLLALPGAAAILSTSWSCIEGSDVTTFPSCNSLLSSGESCATVLDRPGKRNCLCNQAYLDSLFGCENELRLCFLNDDLDNTFESAMISWQSLCSISITFSPTTPIASAYTPHPDELCNEVKKACRTAKNLYDECLSYVSDIETSRFSSCTCRSQVLRQDYSCEFIGNVSCHSTDAAMSNLLGYGCDNFGSVIGTGLAHKSPVSITTPSELQDLPFSTPMAGSVSNKPPAETSSRVSAGSRPLSNALLILCLIMMIVIYSCLP